MQGKFNSMSASQLGAVAIKAAVEQAGVKPAEVDDLIFGNVLGAGQGQAPARQAALGAGLDKSTPATTINKMCGSGMKAAMMAFDAAAGRASATIVVAGGMESMTNAPHLLPKGAAASATATGRCSTTWPSTASRTPTTASRWATSPTPPRRSTASRARRWTPTRRHPPTRAVGASKSRRASPTRSRRSPSRAARATRW